MPIPTEIISKYSSCCVIDSSAEIKFSESGCTLYIQNPSLKYCHVFNVDGCIITKGIRCDYLINIDGIDTSVFLELKGSDLDHAYEQLSHTSTSLDELRLGKIIWLLCYSGRPSFVTSIQNMIFKARSNYNARLLVQKSESRFTV